MIGPTGHLNLVRALGALTRARLAVPIQTPPTAAQQARSGQAIFAYNYTRRRIG